ncbi:hypothetical protein [Streptomyces sp. NPDC005573]|uniref:hypothetical protein n=1 Tax=Streptomyces sp. NPDC005573 TaxID=3156890 RepID=UPI0033B514E7
MNPETGAARPSPEDVPAAERGATRITDRVVAKIAAQAAREAIAPLPGGAAPPHATVVVRHRAPGRGRAAGTPVATARVRVQLELAHPCDIGARCAAVRRHVVERVGALTGMAVPEVVIQVERLHPVPASGDPHGRTS